MMSDLFRKAGAVPRRSTRSPVVWIVIVVACAWLVAACTDGGDETTQTDSAAGETDGDLASDAGGGQMPTQSLSL